MRQSIHFYRESEPPYGVFSNFSRHGFTLDGREWMTVEHYFQASKFTQPAHQAAIQAAPDPMTAKLLGQTRDVPLRADWELVKDDVMRRAVLAKFVTHAEPRAVLLSTGDALLVEDSRNDSYWGAGATGKGRNMLGCILMETREILRTRDTDG